MQKRRNVQKNTEREALREILWLCPRKDACFRDEFLARWCFLIINWVEWRHSRKEYYRLSPKEQEELVDHLTHCDSCRGFLAAIYREKARRVKARCRRS